MNRTLSVFISGKESELDDERSVARRCIEELGFHAVASEVRGAYPGPIRMAFASEVRESDIYVGIFGRYYSWPTIREFGIAKSDSKPCLIYEKELRKGSRRDGRLSRFLASLKRPVRGVTVGKFRDAVDLYEKMRRDIIVLLATAFRNSRKLDPGWRLLTTQIPPVQRHFGPAAGSKRRREFAYRIVLFSLDGVLFDKPTRDASGASLLTSFGTWSALFERLRISSIHHDLAQMFENGEIGPYLSWTKLACLVLKAVGLERSVFHETIMSRPFIPGVSETFAQLRRQGIITAVISGSFEALAQRARKELGISYIMAHCSLEFDKAGRLSTWKLYPTDYSDKARFLEALCTAHNVRLDSCAYVGDGASDIEAFRRAGISIAFNPDNDAVRQAADVVVYEKDLRAILPHLRSRKGGHHANRPSH
jgi:phosphoserine phosphatase